MQDDAELLRCYVDDRSEPAFAALVQRHLNLVYSAAGRLAGGDRQLAEDIAQKVFIQLAAKAPTLRRHPALTGWLYSTTRFLAIDALRAQQRRQTREHAEAMNAVPDSVERGIDWDRLRPLLDDALNDLSERDRQAVLLRFFEGRSYGEVGAVLGANENTARMRVDRALEKLRTVLGRRGLTSSAATLAMMLTENAVTAAPAGLAGSITAAALTTATAGVGTIGLLQVFLMNKLTIAVITGVVVAGATTAVSNWKTRWERTEMTSLRQDNERLRRISLTNPTGQPVAVADLEAAELVTDLSTRLRERNTRLAQETLAAAASDKPQLRNLGMGTPAEALETFTWACYLGDIDAIAQQIHFDGDGRKRAEAVLARMPEAARREWSTPERLYAFFTAADCLVYPPPSDPAILKKAQIVFLKSDRLAMRRPGATSGGQEFQWTEQGWKRAYPEQAIEDLARQVLRTNPMPAAEASGS